MRRRIKEFRVLSRTSTDQYKGPDKPTLPEIAKKLGVNYLVEAQGFNILEIRSPRDILKEDENENN
jgi:hypothetical protein